jgi:hypothetical protein
MIEGEFKGLEDKLRVNVGDFICLKAGDGEKIGGFVKKYTTTKVRLSHEDPANETISNISFHNNIFGTGDRWYCLRNFENYFKIDLNKKPDSD